MANRAVRFDFIGRDVSASKTAGVVGRSFGRLGGRLRGFGAGLGVALGAAAIVKFGKDSLMMAADFDKTMRQVATVTKTPVAGIKNLRRLALDMGSKTSFSAKQAGQAMLELAKGGMSAAQIKAGGLKQTLILAAAGGLELGDSAKTMTNALKAFRIPANKAGVAAAALAGGANASTASVQDLAEALAQVGPGARNARLDLNDTVGVLAAFHNWGLRGSDAGTSLKTMLARLVPVTKQSKDAMRELGLSFVDAHGTMLPIPEIAQRIHDKMIGLSDAERTKAMATIFGSDATRAATILMNEGRAGLEKYIKATKDRGAAEALAKTNTSGAAGAFERLKGAIETVQIEIGTALLPAFANAATWISDRLPGWLSNLKGWWDKNKTSVGQLADALSVFGTSAEDAGQGTMTLKGTLSGLLQFTLRATQVLLGLAIAAGTVRTWFLNLGIAAGMTANAVDKLSGGTGHAADGMVREFRRMKQEGNAKLEEIREKIRETQATIDGLHGKTIDFRVNMPRIAPPSVGSKGPRRTGVKAYAAGTSSAPGGAAIVGERGPELVHLPRGSRVTPNHRLGGATVNISVTVAPGGNPAETGAQIVKLIREHERRSGTSWRAS